MTSGGDSSPVTHDAEIYQRVKGDLTRFANSLVGPDDAADAVATVVARALAKESGLGGLRDPWVYLMRAVRNECFTILRRRRRTIEFGIAPDPAATEAADTIEMVDLVRSLPDKQRAATFLVYWADLAPSQAARILGVSPATLRRYLFLARQKIKEALDVTHDRRSSDRDAAQSPRNHR